MGTASRLLTTPDAVAQPRSVIEEPSFAEARSSLVACRRWDDLWRGIEWALCRYPPVGQRVCGVTITVIAANWAPNMPPMSVIYALDDSQVRLLWMERA